MEQQDISCDLVSSTSHIWLVLMIVSWQVSLGIDVKLVLIQVELIGLVPVYRNMTI